MSLLCHPMPVLNPRANPVLSHDSPPLPCCSCHPMTITDPMTVLHPHATPVTSCQSYTPMPLLSIHDNPNPHNPSLGIPIPWSPTSSQSRLGYQSASLSPLYMAFISSFRLCYGSSELSQSTLKFYRCSSRLVNFPKVDLHPMNSMIWNLINHSLTLF